MNQDFDLSGKTALMTGASGYLGQAMAEALANAGASVCVASRELDRAKSVADRLSKAIPHYAFQLDYADQDSMSQAFEQATYRGPIDILVNNGNVAIDTAWDSVDADEFQRQLQMVSGYFFLSRLFHEHVVGRKGDGSIVMVGSMYAQVASYPEVYEEIGPPNGVAYQASKSGILQLTRHLAVYWAQDKIRVNSLSPGPFPNPETPKELRARIADKVPMKRIGKPNELIGPLLLLVSRAGSYINGHNLIVDGGWTAW